MDLREIPEPDKRASNSLRIVLEEAIDRPELANVVAGAKPIESVEGCKKFHLS